MEHRNFSVFAEGCSGIREEAEFRKSVSPEFECIDRIYEENIIRGIIKDTNGTFFSVLDCLKCKQIIILGIGNDALDAYDLLLGYGLDICCFSSENEEDIGKKVFGKKVLKRTEIIESIMNPVFIEITARYSAWGTREVDFYHYIGYKRNEAFFMLKDYTEIPKNGYMHILNYMLKDIDKKIILIGDFRLCLKLGKVLTKQRKKMHERIAYWDILNEYEGNGAGLKLAAKDEIDINDVCLLMLPGYIGYYDDTAMNHSYRETVKRDYLLAVLKVNTMDILDYPIDNKIFFDGIACFAQQDFQQELKVKRIILGSIDDHSGNIFFRELLDNHPQILMMGYNFINENLFYLCVRLAMEDKTNILPLLWKYYDAERDVKEEDEWNQDTRNRFNLSMEKLLAARGTFSSQELFVMIHIAYAKAWKKEIENISDMVIYWEPHNLPREQLEDYAVWLGQSGMPGCIVNVVRNVFMRKGSRLKGLDNQDLLSKTYKSAFYSTLAKFDIRKKEYQGWERMKVKFEDLKCNPQKELLNICEKWEIKWSDTLLETTFHGEKHFYDNITGFDMAPVYRTYEEYYSDFDRFRMLMIAAPFHRYFGYPYVSILDFSRRELQEMFQKKFRFEKYLIYECHEDEMRIQDEMCKWVSRILWDVRREEVMRQKFVE